MGLGNCSAACGGGTPRDEMQNGAACQIFIQIVRMSGARRVIFRVWGIVPPPAAAELLNPRSRGQRLASL